MNQFENLKKYNESKLFQYDNKINTLEYENNNLNSKLEQQEREFQLKLDEKNEYIRLLKQKVK
jgi:hypothetical protein